MTRSASIFALASAIVLALVLTVIITAGGNPSAVRTEVQVAARALESGRTEFAVIHEGERILPDQRFFPADPTVGRWLRSSPVELAVAVPASESPDDPAESGDAADSGDSTEPTEPTEEPGSATDPGSADPADEPSDEEWTVISDELQAELAHANEACTRMAVRFYEFPQPNSPYSSAEEVESALAELHEYHRLCMSAVDALDAGVQRDFGDHPAHVAAFYHFANERLRVAAQAIYDAALKLIAEHTE